VEFRKPILGDKQGNVQLRILHPIAKKCENYLKIYLFIRITLYMVYQVGYFTVLVIFVLKLYCTNYNILRLQTMKNRDSWRNTSNRLTKCRRRADKIKSSTRPVQVTPARRTGHTQRDIQRPTGFAFKGCYLRMPLLRHIGYIESAEQSRAAEQN